MHLDRFMIALSSKILPGQEIFNGKFGYLEFYKVSTKLNFRQLEVS